MFLGGCWLAGGRGWCWEWLWGPWGLKGFLLLFSFHTITSSPTKGILPSARLQSFPQYLLSFPSQSIPFSEEGDPFTSREVLSWVVPYTRALKPFFIISHFRPTLQWDFSEELILKKWERVEADSRGKESLKQRWSSCPFDAFRFESKATGETLTSHITRLQSKPWQAFLYPNYYSLRISTWAVSIHSGCNWQGKKIKSKREEKEHGRPFPSSAFSG